MSDTYFNIIVKKILKLKGKIINSTKLKKNIQEIMDSNYSDKKAYKIIYYLKQRGFVISLKKDIFYIKDQNQTINIDFLIQNNYRSILSTHCKQYLGTDWYIGGIKALELNTLNFDIPEEIEIVNQEKQCKEVALANKYIIFKTYSNKNQSLFKFFKKLTKKTKIGKNSFLIANLELSILESLYNPTLINENYAKEIIKKFLRKNKKSINFNNFIQIIKQGKHHSSLNRLYKIALSIDPELSKEIGNIIKKYSFIFEIK